MLFCHGNVWTASLFFFSSRRRHTRWPRDWSSDVCSSDLATELRQIEGRYQAQLVQDKARQIELFGQRYREVVTGLARAFELTGGVGVLGQQGGDERLQKAVEADRNLDALAIMPVGGTPHVAYKPDAISRD